jgi:predicted transcriptional regulator
VNEDREIGNVREMRRELKAVQAEVEKIKQAQSERKNLAAAMDRVAAAIREDRGKITEAQLLPVLAQVTSIHKQLKIVDAAIIGGREKNP